MSISRITAYIIATRDDIVVTHAFNDNKYIGWVTLGPEDRCRPLFNTEAIYNSSQEAEDAMPVKFGT